MMPPCPASCDATMSCGRVANAVTTHAWGWHSENLTKMQHNAQAGLPCHLGLQSTCPNVKYQAWSKSSCCAQQQASSC